MAIGDIHDLIALLEQHPDWRAELRRLVLTDELLALPQLGRDLVDAQARTEARLDRVEAALERLADAQARTEDRLVELADAQARTETRLEELAAAQARTETRLEELAAAQVRTEEALRALVVVQTRMEGEYRGTLLEVRYRERPGAYLGRLIPGATIRKSHV